jgi:UDP-2,3-diacylglucosamine pyrophosphatase LpxH
MNAIIISDLHLGSDNCQAKLLVEFLEKIHDKEIVTDRLILNGDVFQNFDSRLHKWNWKVLSSIRRISDEVETIWVRGNHDSYGPALFIAHLIGAEYCEEYIFESGDKKILCIHGDIFDNFIVAHPIITKIADYFYWMLQKIDSSFYLAKMAKHKSKIFLRCVERVKELALKYKQKKGCDYICVGHTHVAEEGDKYYNSGTWTELPPTYLTVDDGKIKLRLWSENG